MIGPEAGYRRSSRAASPRLSSRFGLLHGSTAEGQGARSSCVRQIGSSTRPSWSGYLGDDDGHRQAETGVAQRSTSTRRVGLTRQPAARQRAERVNDYGRLQAVYFSHRQRVRTEDTTNSRGGGDVNARSGAGPRFCVEFHRVACWPREEEDRRAHRHLRSTRMTCRPARLIRRPAATTPRIRSGGGTRGHRRSPQKRAG